MPSDPKDLVKRLREACDGHPHAKIPWPHRILHEAADHIERAAQPGPTLEQVLACVRWAVREGPVRNKLLLDITALYAPASPPVAPPPAAKELTMRAWLEGDEEDLFGPPAAADVTLDWPDEPGEWVREGVPFIVAAVKIGFSDTLRLHPVNYKAGNDWHEWSYSPGIKTPTGGWRRVAPSPCQRCVELERERDNYRDLANEWRMAADVEQSNPSPDALRHTLHEARRIIDEKTAQLAAAQQRADEAERRIKHLKDCEAARYQDCVRANETNDTLTAQLAAAQQQVAPPPAAADATLDWPDEPSKDGVFWMPIDPERPWQKTYWFAASQPASDGKLAIIRTGHAAASWVEYKDRQGWMLDAKWRRVAHSRCVELERARACAIAIADSCQAAVSRLEGELERAKTDAIVESDHADGLQAQLAAAQKRADEAEAKLDAMNAIRKQLTTTSGTAAGTGQ